MSRRLFRAVWDYLRETAGNNPPRPVRLTITLENGEKIKLPVLSDGADLDDAEPLTDLQQKIMAALSGKALRTGPLARACGVDEAKLFRKGGILELKQREMVLNSPEVGYFRTDAPPVAE